MADVILDVKLPNNRDVSGRLEVKVDGKTVRSYEVLGRGSRGPGDTQFLENGNTPTGGYAGTGFETKSNTASYGPLALRLKAVSGNALIAHDQHGRDGLLIHGGNLSGPNTLRGAGALKPTLGCLRLGNEDMLNLHNLVISSATNVQQNRCDLTKITVQVAVETYDSEHGLCVVPVTRSAVETPFSWSP